MDNGEVIGYRISDAELEREVMSPLLGLGTNMLVAFIKKRTPHELVFLQEGKLIFGKKKHDIQLKDIAEICLNYNMITPNSYGCIVIRLRGNKKSYAQEYIDDIFFVAERIVLEMEKMGYEAPKIHYLGNSKLPELNSANPVKNIAHLESLIQGTPEMPARNRLGFALKPIDNQSNTSHKNPWDKYK